VEVQIDGSRDVSKRVTVSRLSAEPWSLIMVMPSDAAWVLKAWHHSIRHGLHGGGNVRAGSTQSRQLTADSSGFCLGDASASLILQVEDLQLQLPPQPSREDTVPLFEMQLPHLTLEDITKCYSAEPFIYAALVQKYLDATCVESTPWVEGRQLQGSLVRRTCFLKPLNRMQATFSGSNHCDCTAMFCLQHGSEKIEVLQKITTAGPPYTDLFWLEIRSIFTPFAAGGVQMRVFLKVVWIKHPRMPGVRRTVEASSADDTKGACEAWVNMYNEYTRRR